RLRRRRSGRALAVEPPRAVLHGVGPAVVAEVEAAPVPGALLADEDELRRPLARQAGAEEGDAADRLLVLAGVGHQRVGTRGAARGRGLDAHDQPAPRLARRVDAG